MAVWEHQTSNTEERRRRRENESGPQGQRTYTYPLGIRTRAQRQEQTKQQEQEELKGWQRGRAERGNEAGIWNKNQPKREERDCAREAELEV